MLSNDALLRWLPKLNEFTPLFVDGTPALRALGNDASIILHGSTTFGVDDAVSDLDVWVLVDDAALRRVDALASTRFFEFKLEGKAGHFTVHAREEFARRVGQCDFPLIAELRKSCVLIDALNEAESLIGRARMPMSENVLRTWFAHHYIEMRSEHRACDNPIERRDATAVLLALTPTIAHALRAAMILDGEPYPYIKWLSAFASKSPTGGRVAARVDEVIQLLGADVLRLPGPECQHPLNLKLREIRQILISAAREQGIDGPWLEHWYLHLEMRRRVEDARWDFE